MNRTCHCLLALLAGFALLGPVAGRAEDPPLVHEVVVDAPVDAVWDAFTTGKGQESWNVAHAEIDLRVGGLMKTHYKPEGVIGDAGTIVNTILAFDPKRMFSIKATGLPNGFPYPKAIQSMWTVLYFEPAGEGKTKVTCRGLGFPSDEEGKKLRAFFDYGNRVTMEKLQKRFAK